MSLEYIRRHYGVPAVLGRRVTVDGRPGVIAVDRQNPYIYVQFDDGTGPCPCHPTWRVEYGELGDPPKISRSKARYQQYLDVKDCFDSFADFLQFESSIKCQTTTLSEST